MNLTELKQKTVPELLDIAREMGIDNLARSRKQDIIFAILKKHAKSGEDIYGDGVLEILQDGFGFLRSADSSYLAGPDDIYVSPSQIRRFNLRKGDSISGKIRPPKEGERYFALLKVSQINFDRPENAKHKILFENLTPLFPTERLRMEIGNGSTEDLTARIIDLTSPIGKGQRGLLVSPPKAGKTLMLQNIATSITRNNPECHLIVLLIDERPEEVTDFKRSVTAEVHASSSDESYAHHVRVADNLLQTARRQAGEGHDVMIVIDSLTRLSRVHNAGQRGSGRTMSGGLDTRALEIPRKLFGAARNIENGGSLTILATVLVETGSRMDQGIFEEFKGTGNMELVLSREVASQRIFPALDIAKSSTRREELLIEAHEIEKVRSLRRALTPLKPTDGAQTLLALLEKYPTNAELLAAFSPAQG